MDNFIFDSNALEGFLIPFNTTKSLEVIGKELLNKSFTSNLNKFGKDKDHNILYITGYSGSGKSTLANYLADEYTDIIHLDLYYESNLSDDSNQNKRFNQYMKHHNIKSINQVPRDQWAPLKILSKFENAVEDFSKEEFKNNRKVICEGVQIHDGGLWNNKSHYKDKPLIIIKSNALKSFSQAFKRDNRSFKDISSIQSIKEWIAWYQIMGKNLKELENTIKDK